MGKGKGGGGGASAPHIQIPSAISGPNSLGTNVFNPLGTFGSEEMLGLGGLANWAANLATGGNVQPSGGLPSTGWLGGGNTQTFAPFTTTGATGGGGLNPLNGPGTGGGGGSFLSGLNAQQLGPFLANAVQNLLNAQGTTAALQTPANTLLTQGGQELSTGNQMLAQATGKTGLFPSQQAMINQAVQTEQTDIGQQLAKEGLGNSTLLQSLKGQAAVSGAAAGGQLIQGNIQLAQTEQQLGAAATGAGAEIENAMFQQFSSIASMSSALQQSLWSQAMQGYGAVGNFMTGVLNSFGYTLKTQEDVLQANETYAKDQLDAAQINEQAQAAQSQGFASMMGGLGQLLGGGGGSGGSGGLGGLFSGLGSLLGIGGGAAGVIGSGAAAGGAATASGVGLDTAITAAGLAFL